MRSNQIRFKRIFFPYHHPRQETVRPCLLCQYFFGKADQNKRKAMCQQLLDRFDPDYATRLVQAFIDNQAFMVSDAEASKQ